MTDVKNIPVDDRTIIDNEQSRGLAPSVLNLPEGPAYCVEGVSLTQIVAEYGDGGGEFIMLISVMDLQGERLGILSPMTPRNARNFAATLIDAANQIDGGNVG